MENQQNNLNSNPSGASVQESSPVQEVSNTDFGMTDQDLKNYKVQSFFGRIKYYFSAIEPALIKTFNTIIYWFIKIAKSVVSSMFKMVLGKDV